MSQTLFLQHFNGFILHRTFVVYHEKVAHIFKIQSTLSLVYFRCFVSVIREHSEKLERPTIAEYATVFRVFTKAYKVI